jgi:hypothetical protein
MVSRREFMVSIATLASFELLQACSPVSNSESYEHAVQSTWRQGKVNTHDKSALLYELVRYATLAPSSHNTQCWKFHVEDDAISILPDYSRRCPAVDPDNHHLFVSLGCATENLVQASLANGLKGHVNFDATSNGITRVVLEPTKFNKSDLFQAIPERQSTRGEYDGKSISMQELKMLELAGTGKNVQMIIFTEQKAMENILDYVIQGNTSQMNSPTFVKELEEWIRFNANEAVRTRDGLYSVTTGNPNIPTWFGNLFFDLFVTPKSENDKYAKQVRSSAGIAIFVSSIASKENWVEVGRCYERFALQATALGIKNAFLNQPVEVSTLRPQFAASLGIGSLRPDLVVRFGRGKKLPQSLRRPVSMVLI